MPYPKYKTLWVPSLPLEVVCPSCGKETGAELTENNFTGKDGTPYKSVKCDVCFTKWIESKYSQEKPVVSPKGPTKKDIETMLTGESKALYLLLRRVIETAESALKALEDVEMNVISALVEDIGSNRGEFDEDGNPTEPF